MSTAPNPRIALLRDKLQEIDRLAFNLHPSGCLDSADSIRNRADEALMELADLEEDLLEAEGRMRGLASAGWPEHMTLPPHACCTEPEDCLCDCLTCAEARAKADLEIVSFDTGDPYP